MANQRFAGIEAIIDAAAMPPPAFDEAVYVIGARWFMPPCAEHPMAAEAFRTPSETGRHEWVVLSRPPTLKRRPRRISHT